MTTHEVIQDTSPSLDGKERSLAAALKEATGELHRRLERALPLTDEALSLARYRTIVAAFHGFHAPLEAQLAIHVAAGGALPLRGRERIWRLREDLGVLGASDPDVDALPRCKALPDVTTPGRALGCFYVIEGATLGGRFICRALSASLGIGPGTGARYFDGYGAETGAMWRGFLAELELSPWPRAESVAGAVDTFVSLESWLGARGALR